MSGVPLRGTRVPADLVLDNYTAGESVAEVAANFDLNPNDIEAVPAYAAARQPALQT